MFASDIAILSLERFTGLKVELLMLDLVEGILLLHCQGVPQQAVVAQGVPGRLRHRIFLTFSTTRVVGHQPYALAAFTPGEIPGTHF